MKELCRCINCNKILEITAQDIRNGDVECPLCSYSNRLTDIRLVRFDKEWYDLEWKDGDIQ